MNDIFQGVTIPEIVAIKYYFSPHLILSSLGNNQMLALVIEKNYYSKAKSHFKKAVNTISIEAPSIQGSY